MPKNWNRRFKHNRDKIKTGDIYELAEVVRNLAIREHDKGLSTGEKQMFTRAKKILASELMYALDKDEDEAEAYLDDLLADPPARAASSAASSSADVGRSRSSWPPGVANALGAVGPKAFVIARRAVRCSSGRSTRCGAAPSIERVVVAVPPGVSARRDARASPGGEHALVSVRNALAAAAGDAGSCSSTTRRARC